MTRKREPISQSLPDSLRSKEAARVFDEGFMHCAAWVAMELDRTADQNAKPMLVSPAAQACWEALKEKIMAAKRGVK